VAVGVAISAFFNNQIAAFATIMATMILLWWVIGPIAQVLGPAESSSALIGYLDLSQHFFANLLSGVMDLADIVYFLSVTSLALFVGTMAVETRRWR
jgi:ABC-2 type transport system permease protein